MTEKQGKDWQEKLSKQGRALPTTEKLDNKESLINKEKIDIQERAWKPEKGKQTREWPTIKIKPDKQEKCSQIGQADKEKEEPTSNK